MGQTQTAIDPPLASSLDASSGAPRGAAIGSLPSSVHTPVGDGVLLVGEDSTIRAIWGRLFQPNATQWIGERLVDTIHPEDRTAVETLIEDLHRGGDAGTVRVRIDSSLIVSGIDPLVAHRADTGELVPELFAWSEVDVMGSVRHGRSSDAVLVTVSAEISEVDSDAAGVSGTLVDRTLAQLDLVDSVGIDDIVVGCLAEAGAAVGADRAFLMQIDSQERTIVVTHEWCGPGVSSDRHHNDDVSLDSIPKSGRRLANLRVHRVDDIYELGSEWEREAQMLERSGIRSLLEVPVPVTRRRIGVIGFDTVGRRHSWDERTIPIVRSVGMLLATAVFRADAELALDASESHLNAGFGRAPVALAIIDLHGAVIRANPMFCKFLRTAEASLIRRPLADHLVERDRSQIVALIERSARDDELMSWSREVRLQVRGEPRWARLTVRVARRDDSQHSFATVYLEDLQRLKEFEQQQRSSSRRYEDLLGLLPDPIFSIDMSGKVRFANDAAMRQFGEFYDLVRATWTLGTIADEWLSMLAQATPTARHWSAELERVIGGDIRSFEVRLVAELDGTGAPESALVVLRDVTDRKHAVARLEYQATHDSLTGLPNRSAFLTQLQSALAAPEHNPTKLAVLFFDLDRFKIVNDSLGHALGDELLVQVAARLRSAIRPRDVLARLGGDEFTVLMSNVDTEAIEETVLRVRQALSQTVAIGVHQFTVSVSVGIVTTSNPAELPTDLLRWSDAAMYRAKRSGPSDHSYFDENLKAEIERQLEMDQRLVVALERREVQVHFQPEVDLRTGRILGCEALLRWAHPEHGLLSLSDFTKVAEDTGAIVGLGAWVLDLACDLATRWRAGGLDSFVLRVNMSVKELERPDVVDRVRRALDRSEFPAENLCIEITESAMQSNPTGALEVLQQLSDLGVGLAIDDFGTGYSSLQYVKLLPVDIIKIDRSFVAGVASDEGDVAIIETILKLAETLRLDITAEGIETEAQRRRLVELGCGRGQGFLFSKAIPADEFDALLAAGGRFDLNATTDYLP